MSTPTVTTDAVAAAISEPTTPPVAPRHRRSFLTSAGVVLRKALHVTETIATVAEPLIAAKVPDVAPIYRSTLTLAMTAETTIAAGMGTGPQKLAQVTAALVPQAQAWAKENNIVWHDADITKWSSAVVDTLNMIPAPAQEQAQTPQPNPSTGTSSSPEGDDQTAS